MIMMIIMMMTKMAMACYKQIIINKYFPLYFEEKHKHTHIYKQRDSNRID